MTYLELCNAVRADANVQGTISTVVGQTQIFGNIVRWVNEAYLDLISEHDNYKFLRIESSGTLSAASRELDLSGQNVEKVSTGSVWTPSGNDTRFQENDWVSFSRAFPLNGSSIETRIPRSYAVIPATPAILRFNTIADTNYTIYFEATISPTALTADANVPVFSTRFQTLIIDMALIKYATFYNVKEILQMKVADVAHKKRAFKDEYLPSNIFYTIPLV